MEGEVVNPTSDVGTGVAPHEQWAQLEKVLRSAAFRLAPGLQKFLRYVASKAIEGLSHEIKEYTIGSEVFERSDGYDPKIDTTVRVQAHRLREKLKEYYEGEGAQDEILLAIPKGHYVPYFSRRSVAASQQTSVLAPPDHFSGNAEALGPAHAALAAGGASAPMTSVEATSQSKRNPFVRLLVGAAGIALLFGMGLILFRFLGNRPRGRAGGVQSDAVSATNLDGPLKDLWADFLRQQSHPIVAYSNAAFLTTQSADLLRIKGEEVADLGAAASTDSAQRLVTNRHLLERAGPVFFQDVYTGTGEVIGVFQLTQMFGQLHSPLGIKRTRLVTTDDLTHQDLIFLGSTRENALLEKLPLIQDFVFDWPTKVRVWSGRILNLHPRPGESPSYQVERDPQTQALRADYALVSFLPGMTPDRRIVILGGLTTLGTQAAAEFATSPSQIAELSGPLETKPQISSRNAPHYFQAVLKVEIMKGDILRVRYVAGHVIRPSQHLVDKN